MLAASAPSMAASGDPTAASGPPGGDQALNTRSGWKFNPE